MGLGGAHYFSSFSAHRSRLHIACQLDGERQLLLSLPHQILSKDVLVLVAIALVCKTPLSTSMDPEKVHVVRAREEELAPKWFQLS